LMNYSTRVYIGCLVAVLPAGAGGRAADRAAMGLTSKVVVG
jgi:hypothetical protein